MVVAHTRAHNGIQPEHQTRRVRNCDPMYSCYMIDCTHVVASFTHLDEADDDHEERRRLAAVVRHVVIHHVLPILHRSTNKYEQKMTSNILLQTGVGSNVRRTT